MIDIATTNLHLQFGTSQLLSICFETKAIHIAIAFETMRSILREMALVHEPIMPTGSSS
jgi:hypothetical protein